MPQSIADLMRPTPVTGHVNLTRSHTPGPSISNKFIPNMSRKATINISNLRLRTFIGFNPEERTKQQDVLINIEIDYRVQPGALADEVDDALNYKTITKEVIRHTENGQFLLLEKLTADLVQICSSYPGIERARVTVDKPNALRFADSVSITLEYNAADEAV